MACKDRPSMILQNTHNYVPDYMGLKLHYWLQSHHNIKESQLLGNIYKFSIPLIASKYVQLPLFVVGNMERFLTHSHTI